VRLACASQLIDSGNREYAAKAAFDPGLLLTSRGGPAGAVDAYRTAVDSGHPEVVGVARYNLGSAVPSGYHAARHQALSLLTGCAGKSGRQFCSRGREGL
jgi:TPR repeat protein